MTQDHKVALAARLFEDFTGEAASFVKKYNTPLQDDVLVVIGSCEAIAYTATRDGETASYQHEFSPHARPELAASFDGRRLYLLAGAYKFTGHGIEDA